MQVLIVDDDSTARDLLEFSLKRNGFDVLAADGGQSALDILEQGNCQVVVCDWQMPEMNGIELCRKIRSSGSMNYIYFILLIGRGEPSDTIEGLTAGADDVLQKPCQPAELALAPAGERLLGLDTRDLLVFALTKLAEARDTDTGLHLERVRMFSRVLAEHLAKHPKYRERIDADFVRLIHLTSPLHDIGKVAVPDSLLHKAGGLTHEEFEQMKSHTTHAAATLDAAIELFPAARYLRMGATSPPATTNGTTDRAIRLVSRATTYRWPGGSWRWPTCMTRSPRGGPTKTCSPTKKHATSWFRARHPFRSRRGRRLPGERRQVHRHRRIARRSEPVGRRAKDDRLVAV